MRIQDVINAAKDNVSVSDWGLGKTPKSRMPLSKAGRRAYNLGNAWRWRFIEFDAFNKRFVVRLIVCESKAIARAHLAMRVDRDSVVLACYEYHSDVETGWHLHTLCRESNAIETAPIGTLVHGRWIKRLPAANQRHRRNTFYRDMEGGAEAWLCREAVRFFRVDKRTGML